MRGLLCGAPSAGGRVTIKLSRPACEALVPFWGAPPEPWSQARLSASANYAARARSASPPGPAGRELKVADVAKKSGTSNPCSQCIRLQSITASTPAAPGPAARHAPPPSHGPARHIPANAQLCAAIASFSSTHPQTAIWPCRLRCKPPWRKGLLLACSVTVGVGQSPVEVGEPARAWTMYVAPTRRLDRCASHARSGRGPPRATCRANGPVLDGRHGWAAPGRLPARPLRPQADQLPWPPGWNGRAGSGPARPECCQNLLDDRCCARLRPAARRTS